MTEQELRQLVRAAVARHVGHAAASPHSIAPLTALPHSIAPLTALPHSIAPLPHWPIASFSPASLYDGLVNVTGECVIEPAVPCDHCGFCKTHGH